MKRIVKFIGPGAIVAVGYMDPGNWATDIAGGSAFGYTLLFVVLLSNLMAIILQHTAIRLGVVTKLDLAQACKSFYPRPVNYVLWILCETAIVAMDLAEVLGSAIALKLLFGIPLIYGVLITSIDILFILTLFDKYTKYIELTVGFLIFIVLSCFCIELFLSKPILSQIIHGFAPSWQIVTNPEMRLIAIGILGATVMPHNLYLHSSLVIEKAKKQPTNFAIKMLTIDSTSSLLIAFFINASILILAAASFHTHGYSQIVDIEQAHQMLNPLLGVTFAGAVFAIALLASGQNASITGTMAGQIVMEGFMDWKIKPWIRRLITRCLAIIPSWAILYYFGEGQTMNLLIFSQVILSFQLGFAVIPLIHFTSSKKIMGDYRNSMLSIILLSIIAFIIIGFNIFSLVNLFFSRNFGF